MIAEATVEGQVKSPSRFLQGGNSHSGAEIATARTA